MHMLRYLRFGGTAMTNHLIYWFPAKRYGWGWGLPSVWQGWVVMGIFAVLLLSGAFMLLPTYGSLVFVIYAVCLCLGLVAVCWVKGEPPTWRWGAKGKRRLTAQATRTRVQHRGP